MVPSIPCVGLLYGLTRVQRSYFKSDVDVNAPLPSSTVGRMNVMVGYVVALCERATVNKDGQFLAGSECYCPVHQRYSVTRKRVGELAWMALDILSSHSSKLVASCNNLSRNERE